MLNVGLWIQKLGCDSEGKTCTRRVQQEDVRNQERRNKNSMKDSD